MTFSTLQDRPLLCCVVPLILIHSANYVFADALLYLALVPANTLITHTYTWNLLTSNFLETSFMKLIFDIGAVWHFSGIIGNPNVEQFGIYFCFSLLAASIGASIVCFFRFVTLGIEGPLIIPIYGFGGVIITMAMFARYLKKSEPFIGRIPNITYNHLPVLIMVFLISIRVIGLKSFSEDVLFSLVSLLFSWSYLRFYYKFNDVGDGIVDCSLDEFTFVGMFPEALHIVLVPFTTAFYNIMAVMGIFPVLESTDKRPQHHLRFHTIQQANEPLIPKPIPKQDLITERRRAKAMKILDAKLAELSNEPEDWEDVQNAKNEEVSTVSINRFKV